MCRMCTFDDPLTVRYIAAIRNAPSTSANPVKALGRKVPVSHTQEGLMKRLLTCSPLAVALALASCDGTATAPPLRPSFDAGGGQGLNLRAGGFGEGSLGAWKSQQGQPDTKGNGNFALYFQKLTTTATNAAGFAVISGVAGQSFSDLNLSWLHRNDGHCGAGAPRWNVGVTGHGGTAYTVFLGCAHADQTAFAPGWISDAFSPTAISAQLTDVLGFNSDQAADIEAGTITSLAIIFDEGTDTGPDFTGFVFLDNITANGKIFTSPGDNGT